MHGEGESFLHVLIFQESHVELLGEGQHAPRPELRIDTMNSPRETLLIDQLYPGLRWLIRLRWLAVTGQFFTCLLAVTLFHLLLPVNILALCLLITLATNLLLAICRESFPLPQKILIPLLLALDTGVLTVMLYWTGGAHNPFSIFYLLHIAMAAILLPQLGSALGVLLCGICYALLFHSSHTLQSGGGGVTCCGSFDFHLEGMFVAMLIVGACISFFIGQISAALGKRETELAAARMMTERHERFAALATLATGMAHELATPLGTIAVVSRELELQAEKSCFSGLCKTDARLIRSEVERCRGILHQLADRTTGGIGDPLVMIDIVQIPELLRGYLREGLSERVLFDLPETKGSILFPKSALLQSLAVVVKNGLEASLSEERVTVQIRGTDTGVIFSVIDQGCGMSPEILEKAGEPFFTTKGVGQGTGLGLFLVRMFLERMNGQLLIESREGLGTTVTFSLPDHPIQSFA